MPIYAFKCPRCQHQQEEVRPVADYDQPAKCGECGEQMVSQVQPTSFSLKGGGWPSKSFKRPS